MNRQCSVALLALVALVCLSSSVDADIARFCQNVFGNRFVSNPRSCQHWIYCQNMVATAEGVCPGNYYFDEGMQMCRHTQFVDCLFDSVDVTCGPNDLEMHPHPSNCDQYVACIQGFPRVINCAPGLHWDAIQSRCDLPANSNCVIATPDPELTYNCDPTRTYVTLHPHDCQKFIVCVQGDLRLNRCASNLLFDAENLRCDLADNVTCRQPEPEDVQHDCNPMRDFYLAPHPTNCQLYFLCLSGVGRVEICAPGLIFDWMDLRCAMPETAICMAPPS